MHTLIGKGNFIAALQKYGSVMNLFLSTIGKLELKGPLSVAKWSPLRQWVACFESHLVLSSANTGRNLDLSRAEVLNKYLFSCRSVVKVNLS